MRQRLERSLSAARDAMLNERMFDQCEVLAHNLADWRLELALCITRRSSLDNLWRSWRLCTPCSAQNRVVVLVVQSTFCFGLVPEANATRKARCSAKTWMVLVGGQTTRLRTWRLAPRPYATRSRCLRISARRPEARVCMLCFSDPCMKTLGRVTPLGQPV